MQDAIRPTCKTGAAGLYCVQKDGRRLTVGVNESSVFYQGKARALKNAFPFNAVEGVLF